MIKTVKLFEENSENNMKTGSIREEAPSEITENKEGSLQRKIREKSVEEFKPGRKTKFQHDVHRMKTLPVMKSSPSRKPQMKPGLAISPRGKFKKVTSISNSTENWKPAKVERIRMYFEERSALLADRLPGLNHSNLPPNICWKDSGTANRNDCS